MKKYKFRLRRDPNLVYGVSVRKLVFGSSDYSTMVIGEIGQWVGVAPEHWGECKFVAYSLWDGSGYKPFHTLPEAREWLETRFINEVLGAEVTP